MPIDRTEESPRLPFMQDPEASTTIKVKPKSRLVVAVISGTPSQVLKQWQSLAEQERNPS